MSLGALWNAAGSKGQMHSDGRSLPLQKFIDMMLAFLFVLSDRYKHTMILEGIQSRH